MNKYTNDLLHQAASVWKELAKYQYIFTYGYKKQLYTLHLTFSPEDFPHLAGFQYLKDISFPRYNSRKIVDNILNGKITYEQFQKGSQFEISVRPRLEALARLKDIIEKDFTLFSYMPRMYPFTTRIQADYLISSHQDMDSFVFILQRTDNQTAICECLCCSAFIKGSRDYEINQRPRIILKKERIHTATQKTDVLFNRITQPVIKNNKAKGEPSA